MKRGPEAASFRQNFLRRGRGDCAVCVGIVARTPCTGAWRSSGLAQAGKACGLLHARQANRRARHGRGDPDCQPRCTAHIGGHDMGGKDGHLRYVRPAWGIRPSKIILPVIYAYLNELIEFCMLCCRFLVIFIEKICPGKNGKWCGFPEAASAKPQLPRV